MGEKRYEIKDHLGNVRATVSDIKNASNYSLSASSWRFLADIKSMNNYFPYGLKVKEGSWSATNYQFAYNGKQEEVFDKDYLDYGARSHNTEIGRFINTDPLERTFPSFSSYAYAQNNPILKMDIGGYATIIIGKKTNEKDWFLMDLVDAWNGIILDNSFSYSAIYNTSILNTREYSSIAMKHAWYNWANYYVNKKGINTNWFKISAEITGPFQAGMVDVNPSFMSYSLIKNSSLTIFLSNILSLLSSRLLHLTTWEVM